MQSAKDLLASSTDALDAVTNMSLDTIILITIFVVLLVYGLRYGKYRMISLLLSFYIVIPIISFFPYLNTLSFLGERESVNAALYSQIGVFLLIVIFLNVILSRFICEEFPSRGIRRLFEAGLLSASSGGLLLAISYHIIPITTLHDFAAPIDTLFASTQMFFWWLVIPLIALLFTVRR
jgi:predicted permease